MKWSDLQVDGLFSLERVCGEYQVVNTRIPGTKLRVKVVERASVSGFMAFPNACLVIDGQAEWRCGMGATQELALQDLLARFFSDLESIDGTGEVDVEWADPRDF